MPPNGLRNGKKCFLANIDEDTRGLCGCFKALSLRVFVALLRLTLDGAFMKALLRLYYQS
jgi:hypothetical protein